MMLIQGKCSLTTLAVTLALLGSPNVHAGLFDFLSGGDDKKTEKNQETSGTETTSNGKPKTVSDGKKDKCSDPAQDLLKTKTMTAAQLMTELRGLKGSFSSGNPMQSMNSMFLGSLGPQVALASANSKPGGSTAKVPPPKAKPAAKKSSDGCESILSAENLGALSTLSQLPGGGAVTSIASSVGDVLLDALISELSYSAIEAFLIQMMDSPDIMSKITVEIPEVASLSPELRKQTLSLGAYLAAIKGSNLMVESAGKEYEKAKESFKKVMEQREKAATALKEAILAKQELKAAFAEKKKRGGDDIISDKDLEYVQKLLDSNPREFFTDPTVQQVAIAYLRSQPGRKDELVEMDKAQVEFKGHYGSYARTAAGAGSMVAFSSMFLKKTKNLLEKQGLAGGAVIVPMISQGANEVGALALNVKNVINMNDDMNEGSFKVMKNDEVIKTGISFPKALGRLDDDSMGKLKANLIREDGKGDIAILYQRSKDSVASLADHIANKDDKKKLAETFGFDNPDMFSFDNALSGKIKIDVKKKKVIGKVFTELVQEVGADDDEKVVAGIQAKLKNNVSDYRNNDGRMIMFARKASTGEETLSAGDYVIRIDNIGMEGLYDQMEFMISESKHGTTRTLETGSGGKPKKGKS